MLTRIATLAVFLLCFHALALGQAVDPLRPGASGWRAPDSSPNVVQTSGGYDTALGNGGPPFSNGNSSPVTPADVRQTSNRVSRAQVSKGSSSLPNDDGQVWREYDITPYTLRDQSSSHPEQAIVDWIFARRVTKRGTPRQWRC